MATVQAQRPTGAFIAVSWLALLLGAGVYAFGLWNSSLAASEKGYYFILLMYGLFSAVSLQKTVRDRLESIPVTGIYYGMCWFSVALVLVLLLIALWNAALPYTEKGFYGMSFLLALFGAVAVQKNVRDILMIERGSGPADAQAGEA
jgi:uncharacterized membrane protein YiaA